MKPVLVVGAATMDTKVHAGGDPRSGRCLAGRPTVCPGGTARNVAEVLARLEVPAMLLSAVGADDIARDILARTALSGLNLSRLITVEGSRSATVVLILDPSHSVVVSVADAACLEVLDKDLIERSSELVGKSELVIADGSVALDALDALLYSCRRHEVPMALVPDSPAQGSRLKDLLKGLFLVSANAHEARALTGIDASTPDGLKDAASALVGLGARTALVTAGAGGVIYKAKSDSVVLPAPSVEVVDPLGAGDALLGGFLYGFLHKLPLIKALEIGQLCASLALTTPLNVHPKLSLEYVHASVV